MYKNLNIKTRQNPRFCNLESKKRIRVSKAGIIHASLTVGKRNNFDKIVDLTRQGGLAEALLRVTRVYAYINFSDRHKIKYTKTFKALDQSERVPVSFYFGMAFAKLMASNYLNYAWAIHYSYLEADGRISRFDLSKSAPDLVGFDKSKNLMGVLEAKGRSGKYDSNAMSKAKKQVRQPIFIDGTSPSKRVAGQLYVNQFDAFEYYWKDPLEDEREPIRLKTSVDTWRYYYWPVFSLYDWMSKNPEGLPFEFEIELSPTLHDLKGALNGVTSLEVVNDLLVQIQIEAQLESKKQLSSPSKYFGLDGITIKAIE